MPEICRFYGIVIKMFFKPKEHDPAHIHAIFDEYVGIFDIKTSDRKVLYNVEEDIDSIDAFRPLKETPGLWQQAQVDKSRTVVSWSDIIDLPSDTLYEYGTVIYQSNEASSDKAAEKSVPYSTVE